MTQYDNLIFTFCPPRESARELKKQKAEEKKAAKQAKKIAEKEAEGEPASKRRKKKDAKEKDGDKGDHRHLQRTRATFSEDDPPVLKSGPDFPTNYRVTPMSSVAKFIQSVLLNKVSILRLKKGSVKKVCSFGLGLGKNAREPLDKEDEPDMKQFVNSTAQAQQATPFSPLSL